MLNNHVCRDHYHFLNGRLRELSYICRLEKISPFHLLQISKRVMSAKIEKFKTEFAKLAAADQRTLLAELTQIVNNAENPVRVLAELVQQRYGESLTTEIRTEGVAHAPVVHCTFTLPNGTTYSASGKNQKIAKQMAAEQALAAIRRKAEF
jgi:dsRNA-specific ribonuclease